MKSMTGYGKAKCAKDGYELTIELKSVNNRFLDINMRLPKSLGFLEDVIRKGVSEVVHRGTVDVFLLFEDKSITNKTVSIDMPLASAYVAAAKKLRTEFLLEDDFQLNALMRSPDVLKSEAAEFNQELLEELTKEALSDAVQSLDNMRQIEGKNLSATLNKYTRDIAYTLTRVESRAGRTIAEYRDKIKARISEVMGSLQIDEARLINEVAFFADRSDICEEITRLKSHLKQLDTIIREDGEQGRKIDFLLQEINREINTVGSKSSDIELTNYVVSMKNDVEKLREQARNIE